MYGSRWWLVVGGWWWLVVLLVLTWVADTSRCTWPVVMCLYRGLEVKRRSSTDSRRHTSSALIIWTSATTRDSICSRSSWKQFARTWYGGGAVCGCVGELLEAAER